MIDHGPWWSFIVMDLQEKNSGKLVQITHFRSCRWSMVNESQITDFDLQECEIQRSA